MAGSRGRANTLTWVDIGDVIGIVDRKVSCMVDLSVAWSALGLPVSVGHWREGGKLLAARSVDPLFILFPIPCAAASSGTHLTRPFNINGSQVMNG
jgi:hypothetical protein